MSGGAEGAGGRVARALLVGFPVAGDVFGRAAGAVCTGWSCRIRTREEISYERFFLFRALCCASLPF